LGAGPQTGNVSVNALAISPWAGFVRTSNEGE